MRLVTYSWIVVVVAVACAAITWLGIAGWLAAAVVIASLAAHVAGNALGTKMREATDLELSRRPASWIRATPVPASRPTHLERSSSLGRLVPVSAAIGAVCGGLVGTFALVTFTACSWAGAVIGGISSAVIGGLFGFLGASFVEILRTSLREAIAAERRAAAADRQR
jgi:tetrahydromethanopterin S-methyltransferase subunit C